MHQITQSEVKRSSRPKCTHAQTEDRAYETTSYGSQRTYFRPGYYAPLDVVSLLSWDPPETPQNSHQWPALLIQQASSHSHHRFMHWQRHGCTIWSLLIRLCWSVRPWHGPHLLWELSNPQPHGNWDSLSLLRLAMSSLDDAFAEVAAGFFSCLDTRAVGTCSCGSGWRLSFVKSFNLCVWVLATSW